MFNLPWSTSDVIILIIVFLGSGLIFTLVYLKRKKLAPLADNYSFRLQPYLLLLFLVLFFLGIGLATYSFSDNFLPEPASDNGEATVPLFLTTTLITGITFLLTQFLLFFLPFYFRGRTKKAGHIKNQTKIELGWTVTPALVFIGLFAWGQWLWQDRLEQPDGEVTEIEVMGEQFSWRVRYPGPDREFGRSDFRFIDDSNDMGIDFSDPKSQDDFMPVQLHIPKGKPVRIYLRSRDVIHSFFIPYLRIKMDALPGQITRVHFTPTVSTEEMRQKLNKPDFNYEIACAELCGRMHFAMKLILVVDEPDEYEAWFMAQKSWLTKHPEYLSAMP